MNAAQLVRRGAAVLVLCGLAVFGSGCNLQWSPYAARVGGTAISPATLDAALKAASSSSGFRCLLERSNTGGYRLKGAGSDTYDSAFVAYVLTNLIDARVAHSLVARRHIGEPRSAYALAAAQVDAAFSSQLTSSGCGATTLVLSSLGSTLARSFSSLQLDEDALAAKAAGVRLTPSALLSYEHRQRASTLESCLSGIIGLKTSAVARTVKARLIAGASVASLVAKYSPNQAASHGVLGCYTSPQLTSVSASLARGVAAASVGSTVGPFADQGTFLVLQVTSRRFEPLLSVLNGLFSAHSSAFSTAITTAVRASHVAVNPQYGRWVSGNGATSSLSGFGGRVVPLRAPVAAYVPNESAVRAKPSTGLPSGTGSGS